MTITPQKKAPQVKPEVKPQVKPEVKPKVKPEVKSEVKSEVKKEASLNDLINAQKVITKNSLNSGISAVRQQQPVKMKSPERPGTPAPKK